MTLDVDVQKRLGAFEVAMRFQTGGGITALFGPSGSGKTTLVNLIAGLLRPDKGRIALGRRVLMDTKSGIFLRPAERRIGYVFQEGRLFPHLSVRSNLMFGRWLTPGARRWGDFDAIVDLLAIRPLLARRPRDLSGGEKQRVAIGRALLSSPECLLMDEPLAALDPARKAEILPFVERLRDEMRLPIVYVSHSVEEVARLADTVVRIEGGRVVASGPVGEIFATIDAEGGFEAGGVLTACLVTEAGADGLARLEHPAGALLVPHVGRPAGSLVRLSIRSRDVTIAVGEPGRLSVRNRLAARITAIAELTPPDVAIRLDVGGEPLVARITRDAVRELDLEPGQMVTALVKAVALDERRG